jgi:methionyl-tRNA synthetase
LQAVWEFIAQANEYIEKTQPFKLAKDPAQAKRLDVTLALLAESLRRISILIEAALPFTAAKIRAQLLLPTEPRRLDRALFGNSLRGHKVGEPSVLFPPIETKPAAGA